MNTVQRLYYFLFGNLPGVETTEADAKAIFEAIVDVVDGTESSSSSSSSESEPEAVGVDPEPTPSPPALES